MFRTKNVETDTQCVIPTQPNIVFAIKAQHGANSDRRQPQKLIMLLGVAHPHKASYAFEELFYFTHDHSNSIEAICEQRVINDSLLRVLVATNVFQLAVKTVSSRVNQIIACDSGQKIWGEPIPSVTELLEVFFKNKVFVFGALEKYHHGFEIRDTPCWTKQIKQAFL